tara:strand:+ start:1338 stop:1652 length:315 start_codon:yes stop_codon:yes gene_type:complete
MAIYPGTDLHRDYTDRELRPPVGWRRQDHQQNHQQNYHRPPTLGQSVQFGQITCEPDKFNPDYPPPAARHIVRKTKKSSRKSKKSRRKSRRNRRRVQRKTRIRR